MMRRFLSLVAILGCGLACRRPEAVPRAVRVEIPVPVPCPVPPEVMRPRLPIEDLRPDTPPAEADRMIAASIALLMGYARQLEEILQGYRPIPSVAPAAVAPAQPEPRK